MAETYIFNIAEIVLRKLASIALEEVQLASGVDSELRKLQNTIAVVRAVLLDAEDQQAKNHQLTNWLENLKDVLYDADDVLDEFQYEALRTQVTNRGDIRRKVCNLLCLNLPFRSKMGHKIKGIRERLDEIARERDQFHLAEHLIDRRIVHSYEREMTHSFVSASDVIGRDDDKIKLIQLLMSTSTDHENVSVIPIVGMGGLGKTTLAKLIYNDEEVVKHFKLKMWVYVSEDFDVKNLAKAIFTSATGTNCRDLTLDHLQTRLRDTLRDKFFLLILDDVWNHNPENWNNLKDFLMVGAKGSKIIVTTRFQTVAEIMGTVPMYQLEGLSHKDCMSLFVTLVFRKGEMNNYPMLLKIGEKIVEKCRGVPLAVKTLGRLLYLKTDEREWLFVKDNEIWEFEQKENDILPALKLSYDSMPSYLKQCFASCSIFPKGHQFYDFELIQFWIAEGLILSSNNNQELEDIGQSYVKELWSINFFQVVEEDFLLTFGMHDLVHDLALLVAQTEFSPIKSHTHNISGRVRHVSFFEHSNWKEVPRFLLELHNVNRLRTILFPVWRVGLMDEPSVETCISRFEYLRVLDFSDSRFEVLPSSVSTLKHLRYLDLSRNRHIKKLPNSICQLLNLQTLRLQGCEGLEGLPRDIGNLIILRYLSLTTRLTVLPEEGIRGLISLRYLHIARCGILEFLGEGMQCLTALRALHITDCDNLESLPGSMKYLTALETLVFSNCYNLNLMGWEEDIEGLRFRLRTLVIRELPQLVALPEWLQVAANTLQFLRIARCRNLATLPMWFQTLTSLQRLEIIDCPLLSALPDEMDPLAALRTLKIELCPELSRRCRQETNMDWPKIAHIPDIILEGENIKSTDNQVAWEIVAST